MLTMPAPNRRMVLPSAVKIRHAVRTGKYRLGDAFVRDPIRTAVVKGELNTLEKLRDEATKTAEAREEASASAEDAV